MFDSVRIAPSILSADLMDLKADIDMIERAGAGYIHLDVMDGHFVPNITMGVPVLEQLVRICDLPVDVHLMVSNPLDQIPWFIDAGAYSITVHAEVLSSDEIGQAVDMIHAADVRASLALKPETPANVVLPAIADLDMVLVMSVEPGFSGQRYLEGTEDKVAKVVSMARQAGVSPLVEADGGIGLSSAPIVAAAGADVLVCGNAVFTAEDPRAALSDIEEAANAARCAALVARSTVTDEKDV